MDKMEFIKSVQFDLDKLSDSDKEHIKNLRSGRTKLVPVMDVLRLKNISINVQIADVLLRGANDFTYDSVHRNVMSIMGNRIEKFLIENGAA